MVRGPPGALSGGLGVFELSWGSLGGPSEPRRGSSWGLLGGHRSHEGRGPRLTPSPLEPSKWPFEALLGR
eukprot:5313437-Pyramimonas_sp.AAC.1